MHTLYAPTLLYIYMYIVMQQVTTKNITDVFAK